MEVGKPSKIIPIVSNLQASNEICGSVAAVLETEDQTYNYDQ